MDETVTENAGSVDDKRTAEWREKLRTKDDSWVREQTNGQLQPNVRKRVAAEEEMARRERESELAKAKQRIAELETELSERGTELSNVRSESVWTRWQTIAGWVAAIAGWVAAVALFV